MQGSLTVDFSEAFFGSLTAIADALNACGDWCTSGGYFEADSTVRYAPSTVHAPMLRPSRVTAFRIRRADGRFAWVDPEAVTYAEALATLEARRETTSLEEISRLVTPAIASGALRIDCWRQESELPRHRGHLTIHADGAVVLQPAPGERAAGSLVQETFDPLSAREARQGEQDRATLAPRSGATSTRNE